MQMQGFVVAPSRLTAEALLRLLQLGILALSLAQDPHQQQHLAICIGLHQSALDLDAPTGNLTSQLPHGCITLLLILYGQDYK